MILVFLLFLLSLGSVRLIGVDLWEGSGSGWGLRMGIVGLMGGLFITGMRRQNRVLRVRMFWFYL